MTATPLPILSPPPAPSERHDQASNHRSTLRSIERVLYESISHTAPEMRGAIIQNP